jgi:hypothetical protein
VTVQSPLNGGGRIAMRQVCRADEGPPAAVSGYACPDTAMELIGFLYVAWAERGLLGDGAGVHA